MVYQNAGFRPLKLAVVPNVRSSPECARRAGWCGISLVGGAELSRRLEHSPAILNPPVLATLLHRGQPRANDRISAVRWIISSRSNYGLPKRGTARKSICVGFLLPRGKQNLCFFGNFPFLAGFAGAGDVAGVAPASEAILTAAVPIAFAPIVSSLLSSRMRTRRAIFCFRHLPNRALSPFLADILHYDFDLCWRYSERGCFEKPHEKGLIEAPKAAGCSVLKQVTGRGKNDRIAEGCAQSTGLVDAWHFQGFRCELRSRILIG
jgi:hypothetical protein